LPGISEDRAALPALAYTVAYPVGAFGIICCMLLLKSFFRFDIQQEAKAQLAKNSVKAPIERRTLRVSNSTLDGARISDIPRRVGAGVIVSRIRPAGAEHVAVATESTQLHVRNTMLAVGTRSELDSFQRGIGQVSDEDLLNAPGQVTYRRVFLTHRNALGRSIAELARDHSFGVIVTRVTRSDLEMTAVPDLRLQFGDVLQIFGSAESIDKAATFLGNSV
jgi:putative transport protein